MRLAFMGTPAFSLPALSALIEAGHEIVAVYSQPPAPRGRGRALALSPVHAYASSLAVPVRTPLTFRADHAIADFQALDLDAAVVVAYGQILPPAILEAPRLGSFNLHASLLPRWRGAAPIQRAIIAGDTMSGVCVMRMTEGLDEGPILASTAVSLDPLETSGSLHERLAAAGAPLIVETLDRLRRGSVAERSQSSGEATYAKKIRPSEPRLRWADSAERVDRLIRGLSPLPGGWFTASIRNAPFRIKALLSRWETGVGEPGEILDDAFLVACGSGAVRILRAQREGRAARDAAEFLRGFPLGPADRLG